MDKRADVELTGARSKGPLRPLAKPSAPVHDSRSHVISASRGSEWLLWDRAALITWSEFKCLATALGVGYSGRASSAGTD